MQQKLLKAAQLYVVYKSLKHKVTHVSAAQELGLDGHQRIPFENMLNCNRTWT